MPMYRLKSRKLWITLLTGSLLLLLKELGIEMAPETLYALVTLVTGYNLAQGYADRG